MLDRHLMPFVTFMEKNWGVGWWKVRSKRGINLQLKIICTYYLKYC